MVIYGRYGQKLIQETPITLMALTRHPVEPHEEQWFARCRADYLRSFPLTLLEIARVFFLLVLIGPLANDLNMTTTVESVELVEQLEKLQITGRDQVQGFYFSRAIPASELDHAPISSSLTAMSEAPSEPVPMPSGKVKQGQREPFRPARRRALG